MLRVAFCLLLAFSGAASAQDQLTLDVELPVGEDRPRRDALRGNLSVTPTGKFAIALERSVVLADRRGRAIARIPLAAAERKLAFVCVVAVDDNDIAVLQRYTDGADKRGLVLSRHGADGRLKRERHIVTSAVDVENCVTTRDNALMLIGNEGAGRWWFAKFSIDGVKVFESRAGTGHAERLAAMGSRPGAHWYALVQRLRPGGTDTLDWYLHHYLDGKAKEQLRAGIAKGHFAAILEEGSVIADDGDTLYFVDDLASVRREAAWPFRKTAAIVPGDDGFWAVVSEGNESPDRLIRVNAKGDVRHRHEPMRISGLARTSDNQIAVVVVASEDGRRGRLLRFDHRSSIEHLP